jgi:hypothetical protein
MNINIELKRQIHFAPSPPVLHDNPAPVDASVGRRDVASHVLPVVRVAAYVGEGSLPIGALVGKTGRGEKEHKDHFRDEGQHYEY